MAKKLISDNRGKRENPSNYCKIMKNSNGEGLDKYRFMFHLNINQYAVLKNGWELDFLDICVFLSIYTFISSGKADKYRIIDANNVSWYFISEQKIIRDLPLLPINSESAIIKRISNLCKYNLIERKPDNRVNGKKYLRIGDSAKFYFYNYSTDKTPETEDI